MLCYRDMAFCSSGLPGGRCSNPTCDRRVTEIDRQRAKALGLPFQWMDYWDRCLIREPSPNHKRTTE